MVTATAKAAAPVKDDPISQETRNRAALVAAELPRKYEAGQSSITHTLSKDLYAKLLDFDGVTVADADRVAKANANVAAAVGLATGEVGLEVMKKHTGLDNYQTVLPASGRDRIEATFDRTYQSPLMERTADGKMIRKGAETRYGALTVGYKTFGTRNVGQMATIKTHLQSQAMEMLTKS